MIQSLFFVETFYRKSSSGNRDSKLMNGLPYKRFILLVRTFAPAQKKESYFIKWNYNAEFPFPRLDTCVVGSLPTRPCPPSWLIFIFRCLHWLNSCSLCGENRTRQWHWNPTLNIFLIIAVLLRSRGNVRPNFFNSNAISRQESLTLLIPKSKVKNEVFAYTYFLSSYAWQNTYFLTIDTIRKLLIVIRW